MSNEEQPDNSYKAIYLGIIFFALMAIAGILNLRNTKELSPSPCDCPEQDTVFVDVVIHDTVIVHDTPSVKIVHATKYQPTPFQCDETPLITGDGSYIDTVSLKEKSIRWCALSQNLLWFNGGPYRYGDTVTISCPVDFYSGDWVVHDAIGIGIPNTIDFLTWTDWPVLGRKKVFIYQNI